MSDERAGKEQSGVGASAAASRRPSVLDDEGDEVPHDGKCRRSEIFAWLTDPTPARSGTAAVLCGCRRCNPKAWQ